MKFVRNLAACSFALAAVATSGAAFAQKPGGFAGPMLTAGSSAASLLGVTPLNVVNFNVAGIDSFDDEGAAINVVRSINVGANNQVIGIGWNVNLSATSPSYLSELVVSFGNSTESFVNLTPGFGDDFGGTATYNSGGIIDLIGLGFDFTVGADGQLRMEFFEGFDDFPGAVDGRWVSGSLSIQLAQAIPEPSTYAMMFLGLLAVGAFARKRMTH